MKRIEQHAKTSLGLEAPAVVKSCARRPSSSPYLFCVSPRDRLGSDFFASDLGGISIVAGLRAIAAPRELQKIKLVVSPKCTIHLPPAILIENPMCQRPGPQWNLKNNLSRNCLRAPKSREISRAARATQISQRNLRNLYLSLRVSASLGERYMSRMLKRWQEDR